MNVLQAQHILLQYFLENDNISSNEINKLILDKKSDKTKSYSAFVAALEDMTKKEILCEVISNESDNKKVTIWILKKPIILYEQNVIVDGDTATKISEIIKAFSEALNINSISCNPLSIQQKDILYLIEIINMYALKNNNQEEQLDQNNKS